MKAEAMPTDHRAALRNVRTIKQLVAYLRDEMSWPMKDATFDDLTFDYTAEELGIDPKNAAKIEEIKRLRPLSPHQPWGIFFVKFEPKKLPVVALRRILSQVALKKRASANSAERTAWAADDLLFISNYGDGDERQISFAHFSQTEAKQDLPTLKVLGWDNLDTALHLDAIAKELTGHLSWPENDADIGAWRTQWRGAFTLRHREVITTSKDLSIHLADLARAIRDRIKTTLAIETEAGPLTKLMKAFQETLVHDLDAEGFADMYAQTIAYGLLSARISDPNKKTADDFAGHMRTSPFLRDLMETFLKIGGRRGRTGGRGIDFDELGVSEVVDLLDDANMEAVVRDFGDRNPQEDPVIHFYELFLSAYNKQLKVQRGVFYTPQPVVSYIVRSVHELLQTEFGLADGLADITTWGELVKSHPGMKLPPLTDEPGEKRTISPDEPFVQILDPATGTATFLVEVIEVIHRTLTDKWKRQRLSAEHQLTAWNDYVPKHLLPRLHAFELMMAPYAIAHMKVSLKLAETGYRFGSDERAQIYLTNALEPKVKQLPQIGFDALAHEAAAVNEVKWNKRFTVVIGNPPYSNFGQLNKIPFILGLLEEYKRNLNERKLNLDDDFIKFMRLSQHLLECSGVGTLGMITNSTFLDGVNHRRMREMLVSSFPKSYFLNLHGNTKRKENPPPGLDNENVFDIMQGVSISLMTKPIRATRTEIHYYDAWGTREEKYRLLSTSTAQVDGSVLLSPLPPRFFLVEKDFAGANEYEAWPSLTSVLPLHSLGIETSRDDFAVAFEKDVVAARIADLCSSVSDNVLRNKYGLDDKRDWNLSGARRELKKMGDLLPSVRRVQYRPLDERFICYSDAIVTWPRHEVLDNLLRKNLGLICVRNSREESTSNFYCTQYIADKAVISSRDNATVFPLYRYETEDSESLFARAGGSVAPNFSPEFLRQIAACLGQPAAGDILPAGLVPEDIFYYIYAIFHSPAYRNRYAEFLKIDFPRLPLTKHLALFRALARLGKELVDLHVMDSPKLKKHITEFIGRNTEVDRITWSNKTVWINKDQSVGFKGVPEAVWRFHIGGYQVCEKSLKDRKGQTLTRSQIDHYHRVVVALHETIAVMSEIDKLIDQHGGWPLK